MSSLFTPILLSINSFQRAFAGFNFTAYCDI